MYLLEGVKGNDEEDAKRDEEKLAVLNEEREGEISQHPINTSNSIGPQTLNINLQSRMTSGRSANKGCDDCVADWEKF